MEMKLRKLSSLPWCTFSIIVFVVFMYWLETEKFGISFFSSRVLIGTPTQLVKVGGAYRYINWSVVISVFQHLNLKHLSENITVLILIGSVVEKMFNSKFKYLVVFTLIGVVGNVVSVVLMPSVVFMGMSGSIAGLAGILVGSLLYEDGQPIGKERKKVIIFIFLVVVTLGGGMQANLVTHLTGGVLGLGLGIISNKKRKTK